MNDILQRIGELGIVPVVKLEKAEDAVSLGRALLEGDLPIAEVTFRTDAAEESIRTLSKELPELLVGAGTVLTKEQVRRAVDAGAKFIVTPGFNPSVVDYCVENHIPITPGINSPSQIEMALERGLNVVKFFPAEQSGGLPMLKAMSAPYGSVKFIPTGGVDTKNMLSYLAFNKILAVGGSWMVKPEMVAAGQFDEIARITREAVYTMHGFELAHLGVNCSDGQEAADGAEKIASLLGMAVKDGNSSIFAGKAFEFMKSPYLGEKGHVAISCNDVGRALAFLKSKGIGSLPETEKKKDGRTAAIYLDLHVGGFIFHLLQK
ncbi:MAG TPA: bifunctional 4-hydroxy-2-oxoglutarate aldolase/2-dehydro-3-deoxy-phosphogluconate aldolase [Aminivibrio sp.]|uniref:bifunctional 4-hydroxy-2-oxoglutarate aldolase/2-dehydro-3-deoxy-phosphogluconate aldolase n=1 Tax=Aminivibrio sp. TaxID=1872489 RepID=UPI002BC74B96|nr:bifunctional 4-hydroxy-2-oxoglutarate aldolase/2-dehydro-3-deoxy-phosphogluconate aldolase [Aminivibrio sp.]HPF86296.1 bifunctional 4-hydroxy-2-oxoglutarate aldolase/2-dehydro-3-deoxy-phosphogluconate aldolase [Aminivibrio sp.]